MSASKEYYIQLVCDGSMKATEARSYTEGLTFDTPFRRRVEFVHAVAPLVALFSNETKESRPPNGKPLRQVFHNACEPSKIEYMLNNTRRLHKADDVLRGFLAAGSCGPRI